MVCIMSKCIKCRVEFQDPAEICPFCGNALSEHTGDETFLYPKLKEQNRGMHLAMRIYLFAAVVGFVFLLCLNHHLRARIRWDLLAGIGMLYAWMTWKVSFFRHEGYLKKALIQTFSGILAVIAVDGVLGFHGWSLNYVMPGVFVLMDIAMIVLMIVNSRNWQSYLPVQIIMILCSLIPVLLYHMKVDHAWYPAVGALGITVLVFLGTLAIGGRRAVEELRRRFHV